MRAFWVSLVIVFGLVGLAVGQVPNTLYSTIVNAVSVSFPLAGTEKFVITQGGATHSITSSQLIGLVQTTGNSVASNAALAATATITYPSGVWRITWGNGNGAPPQWFTPGTGNCAANSLVNDGGSCVDSTPDGNSWIAAIDSTGYNPLQFGATGNGSTDDTVVVQAALDAAANAQLNLGPHIYAVSGLFCSHPVAVVGTEANLTNHAQYVTGTGVSGFRPTAINQTTITMIDACNGSLWRNFFIDSGAHGANAAGRGIYLLTASNVTIENVALNAPFIGLDINGFYHSVSNVRVTQVTGAGAIGIRVGHLTTAAATLGLKLSGFLLQAKPGSAGGTTGLLIEDAGGIYVSNGDIQLFDNGTYIFAGNGGIANQQVNWPFFNNTIMGDTSSSINFLINTARADAYVKGVECIGCWASSSASNVGVAILNTAASANFSGFHFVGARIYNNYTHGVLLDTGTDIDFEASHICGNNVAAGGNAGIVVGNLNNLRVRGGAIGGTCDGFSTTQVIGIYFPGTNANVLVQGVDVSQGNTTPISYGATTTGRIEGNPGFNPLGPVAMTITGSPFTYTAGNTTEVACLTGGTITSITIGGLPITGAGNSCVTLAPAQAMVLTYTGLPTGTASRQ